MGPAETCARRLAARMTEFHRLERSHRALGTARLAGVAVGLVGIWWVGANAPAYTWIAVLALAAGLLYTSSAFSRTETAMQTAALAALFYRSFVNGEPRTRGKEGNARALGAQGDHPFAFDVDVLQPDGLFERLNLATTREGMRELARFLTEPAGAAEMRRRQAAVKELKPCVDLREQLFVEGSRHSRHIRTDEMLRWGSRSAPHVPLWIPATLVTLSALVVCAFAALALRPFVLTYSFLGASLLCETVFWYAVRNRVRVPSLEAPRLHVDFGKLEKLLRIAKDLEFDSPRLRELRAGGLSASQALQGLFRILSWYEARHNQIVALFGPLVAFETQVALAVERWRIRHGPQLREWIGAVATLEAYSSLGTFAYENPTYVFPDLSDDGPRLHATGLAHPLLRDEAVPNDVALDSRQPILVVSGANMAGKSTLLRTIGINVSLAYSGAPVRATSMTMSDLAVIASVRVTDSLQRGESRFSAELRRIQAMLESVQAGRPTLALIDELFGGTNSYDRYTGALALTDFLMGSDPALAVLSTHDRNVTRWVEENSGQVRNVHFRDTLKGGRMSFDYRLRNGPATHGNAVELMRLAGIPVRGRRLAPRA